MADYLALFDRRCALNVACLIPNGNLRVEVFGLENRPPTAEELRRMGQMVREGMEQGAVGLSTGLDYIPSRYASTEELIALCREMAAYDGVYVTHQRRYDPEGVIESMDEVYRIGRESGVPVHISHFNSQAEIVLPKLDEGRRQGIDVTYDLYCVAVGLSPAQIKAYRIADNQTARLYQWDDDRLVQELAALQQMDFDLDLTGFSAVELAELLEPGTDGPGDPDDVPEPPDEPITQPGDLWILGKHRLLCGDSSHPVGGRDGVDGRIVDARVVLIGPDGRDRSLFDMHDVYLVSSFWAGTDRHPARA